MALFIKLNFIKLKFCCKYIVFPFVISYLINYYLGIRKQSMYFHHTWPLTNGIDMTIELNTFLCFLNGSN